VFAYVALVTDAYARRILGWRVAATMATSMVLDAIEQLSTRAGTPPPTVQQEQERCAEAEGNERYCRATPDQSY
jgi:transposase InsO family protein